ncbi:transcriptional antiterminator, partial [Microbacterium sp. SUBG005]
MRGLLGGTELTLERSASTARLRGTEVAQRRLLSKLAHDEMDAACSTSTRCGARWASARSARAFGPFKAELVAELGALGYYVNEIGIGDVVMHIAIAADRTTRDRALGSPGGDS